MFYCTRILPQIRELWIRGVHNGSVYAVDKKTSAEISAAGYGENTAVKGQLDARVCGCDDVVLKRSFQLLVLLFHLPDRIKYIQTESIEVLYSFLIPIKVCLKQVVAEIDQLFCPRHIIQINWSKCTELTGRIHITLYHIRNTIILDHL